MINITIWQNMLSVIKFFGVEWLIKHLRTFFKECTNSIETKGFQYTPAGFTFNSSNRDGLYNIAILMAVIVSRAVSFGRGSGIINAIVVQDTFDEIMNHGRIRNEHITPNYTFDVAYMVAIAASYNENEYNDYHLHQLFDDGRHLRYTYQDISRMFNEIFGAFHHKLLRKYICMM
jgi:hypothetical protein